MAEQSHLETLTAAAASEEAPTQVTAPSAAGPEEPQVSASGTTKRCIEKAPRSSPEDTTQAHGDQKSPPRKRVRKESTEDVESEASSDQSTDEGEVDSEGISRKTSISQLDGQDSSPEPTTANGAPSVLRTSFATSVPKKFNPDLAGHNKLTAEEQAKLSDGLREGESKTDLTVNRRGVVWFNPPVRADTIQGSTWLGAVDSALREFCAEFVASNQENINNHGLKRNLLKTAFLRRIGEGVVSIPEDFRNTAKRQMQMSGWGCLSDCAATWKKDPEKKIAKRKAKKEARQAKKSAEKEKGQQQLEASTSTSAHTSKASTPKNVPPQDPSPTGLGTDEELEEGERIETDIEMDYQPNESGENNGQQELELRQRYYPGIASNTPFCITCTSLGHSTASCPEAKCKFCHEQHFTYRCPSRQRCKKCKQLGHIKSSCTEKLAVAPGEGFMECALCEGQDHQEESCTELWQTYHPKIGSIKKVKRLPIFCHWCGAEGHFGSDCGLADPKVPPSDTWTMAHASLYIDSESSKLPIVDKNPPPSPPEDSKPIIPGRSIKPQSHVIFEESDDDGEGFIRAPAANDAKTTKSIQIKSNINFGGNSNGAHSPLPSPLLPSVQQQNSKTRRTQRRAAQQAMAVINAPPPPPRQGTRRYPLRSGKQAPGGPSNNTSRGQQQPPLPPGPPPPPNGGTSSRGGRGRGGFSNLGRRSRSGRGGHNH